MLSCAVDIAAARPMALPSSHWPSAPPAPTSSACCVPVISALALSAPEQLVPPGPAVEVTTVAYALRLLLLEAALGLTEGERMCGEEAAPGAAIVAAAALAAPGTEAGNVVGSERGDGAASRTGVMAGADPDDASIPSGGAGGESGGERGRVAACGGDERDAAKIGEMGREGGGGGSRQKVSRGVDCGGGGGPVARAKGGERGRAGASLHGARRGGSGRGIPVVAAVVVG